MHRGPKWEELPRQSRAILTRKRNRDLKKQIVPDAPLEEMLYSISVRNLRVIARNLGIRLGVYRKHEIIVKLSAWMLDPENTKTLLSMPTPKQGALLKEIVEAGGIKEYNLVITDFGPEKRDSPYWFFMTPRSALGQLRALGILFVGEAFTGTWLKILICIPGDLRELINPHIL